MKAVVISIGYEILQGRVINSNAAFISRRLMLLGIDVVAHISVGDSFEDISKAFDIAIKDFNADLIVTTGGLGPTYDDITSEALSRYFGEEHILNEDAFREIREKYESRGMTLTPERIKMAYMPKSAKSLSNPVGIAPGILLMKNNKIIISLPGVPTEMEGIWEAHVESFLRRYGTKNIAETSLTLIGVPESTLAKDLNRYARDNPDVYIKTHPKGHETRGPVNELYIMTSTSKDQDPEIVCIRKCRELIEILRNNNPNLIIEGDCICKKQVEK